jgi:hypothetical protein
VYGPAPRRRDDDGGGYAAALFAAQARESRLVVRVERGSVLTGATAATTEVTAGTTTAAATGAIATTTTAAATAATGALGLNVAGIDLDELLGLALALALVLGVGGREELILLLGEGLEVLPLLVLDALVGLADLELALEGKLLLGQLGEVLVVGHVLLLRLLLLGLGNRRGLALGFLRLGDLGGGLLVLQLGLAFDGAPGLASLLLRVGTSGGKSITMPI